MECLNYPACAWPTISSKPQNKNNTTFLDCSPQFPPHLDADTASSQSATFKPPDHVAGRRLPMGKCASKQPVSGLNEFGSSPYLAICNDDDIIFINVVSPQSVPIHPPSLHFAESIHIHLIELAKTWLIISKPNGHQWTDLCETSNSLWCRCEKKHERE